MRVIGTPLYQWESGRRIQLFPLLGMKVNAVHFSNLGDSEALVVEPKEENGTIVADIPNVLLQSGRKLVVHTVNVSQDCCETILESVFSIRPRPRPSDYVYVETEVRTYEALEDRIEKLEQGGTGGSGEPGKDGKDGITPHIGDNGNWFIGEEDTGKSSRGEPGKDGKDGQNGQDGKTPVKGEDYWTEDDKNEIVNDVLEQITDSGGNVDQVGLSAAQIAALDGMFKIASFTADPTDAYIAFKNAFGISDEPTVEQLEFDLIMGNTTYAAAYIKYWANIDGSQTKRMEMNPVLVRYDPDYQYTAKLASGDYYMQPHWMTFDNTTDAFDVDGTKDVAWRGNSTLIGFETLTGGGEFIIPDCDVFFVHLARKDKAELTEADKEWLRNNFTVERVKV